MSTKKSNLQKKRTIGQRIRQARKKRGLTQQQVSQMTGMTVTAISGLENGRRPTPRIDTVQRLSTALGTNLLDEDGFFSKDLSHDIRGPFARFLESPLAEIIELQRGEIEELKQMRFFFQNEKITNEDWLDMARLRRRIRNRN